MNCDWRKVQLPFTSHHNDVLGSILITKYAENNNEDMEKDVYISNLYFADVFQSRY